MRKFKGLFLCLMWLLLVAAIIVSWNSKALQHQVDFGYSEVEHAWQDHNGYARYRPNMKHLGYTLWFDTNIGLRVGHGFMQEALEESGGVYKNVAVDFKRITAFELQYRYYLNNNTYLVGGIGTYITPTNHIYYRDGKVSGGRIDSDDDEGWLFGISTSIAKRVNVEFRFNHYSQISKHKEYIKGLSVNVNYTF